MVSRRTAIGKVHMYMLDGIDTQFTSKWTSPDIVKEKYKVHLRIQSECGKIWTIKTPNTDTFQAAEHNIETNLILLVYKHYLYKTKKSKILNFCWS